ncbi:MAG: hypothetical protein LC768_08175 [Acidobacteria bacterium]|nr:hypothetical protein [Acidobacteriota bacterium]
MLAFFDEGFAQTVHTRTSYKPGEIVWNAKFVNLYNEMNANEPISINIRKLSQIEKVSRELHP